jgi:oligopeptide/dipeptide ABC transporter ATP-binding protein
MPLLEVDRLTVSFGDVSPVDGVSFSLDRGQVLGLVGESGSGKSVTAMAVLGLLPMLGGRVTGGSIRFDDIDLLGLPGSGWRGLRGRRIAWIPQNPMTSLDPIRSVGEQVDQVSELHLGLSRAAARKRSVALMERMRIAEPSTVHSQYPHQLSGGMKQRVVIAMALAADPELIVADEPTTALDVTIQAQIVQLLADLVRERELALLLVTHDMGVVAQACDRVAVLYAGRLAEVAPVQALFSAPRHPYTRALIDCVPRDGQPRGSLQGIPGAVPAVRDYPPGCRFHPRCPRAEPDCRTSVPAPVVDTAGMVACIRAGEAGHG